MIAAKRKSPQKEKLKDIIDAVAAKQDVLRPLPVLEEADAQLRSTLMQPQDMVFPKSSDVSRRIFVPQKKLGIFQSFWQGFCWALGFAVGMGLMIVALLYIFGLVLRLPTLAVYAATVFSLLSATASSLHF